MKIRTALFLLLAGLIVSASPAQNNAPASAQSGSSQIDPEKAQQIRHMLDVMGVTKQASDVLRAMMPQMMKTMEDSMKSSMANAMPGGSESAEAQQRAADYMKKYSALVQDKMIQKFAALDLTSIYINIYDKYFSADDIRAITVFYESPAGRKMMNSVAPMMADIMSAMAPAVTKMTGDIQKEIYAEHPDMDPKNWH